VRYLFDTDALSQPLRRRPAQGFVRRIRAVPGHHQFTTAISAAELLYGAWRRADAAAFVERVRAVLSQVRVVPFDELAAETCGRLHATLDAAGTPLATADLLIAAIALSGDFVLVTGNTRHFERVPDLRIEEWIGG
jgi:predicted nucleic acid-binding protein